MGSRNYELVLLGNGDRAYLVGVSSPLFGVFSMLRPFGVKLAWSNLPVSGSYDQRTTNWPRRPGESRLACCTAVPEVAPVEVSASNLSAPFRYGASNSPVPLNADLGTPVWSCQSQS